MKVLYIPSLNAPVVQWRIEYPAREMYKQLNEKDRGAVYVDYIFPATDNIAWDAMCLNKGDISDAIQQRINSACKYFDVIIFQKIQNKEGLAILGGLKEIYPDKLFVAEIDDSIGDITPSNYQLDNIKDHLSCAAYHVNMSDAVICSTSYLSKSISKINTNTHVYPNCINYDIWNAVKKDNKSKDIRIGYVAGGGHDEDLLIAYRAMLPIMESNKKVKFVVRYGGFRPDWLNHKQVDFELVSWEIDVYPKKLASLRLDIMLAPLRDTEFNRCKSNLKWIESSALNTPLIASKIEPFVNTNGNLFLVSNDISAWTNAINDCINRYELISKDNFLKQNKENYSIQDEVSKLLVFLKNNYDKKFDNQKK